ncbi:MAG: preprotein translocase subunit SecE [Planctomycetota bacterium]
MPSASTPANRSADASSASGGGGFMSVYKPGQGYYTRWLSAAGFGAIVLAGVGWLWGRFSVWVAADNLLYWQGGMAAGVILGFAALFYYLFGVNKRIVQFCIDTEAEMNKVNWPSRREVIGSTLVVIAGTFLMAALLFVVDIGFFQLFRLAGVLESGGE